MCLDNEAHGLELQHPIFRGPLATTPTLHDIATPAHYRSHWNGRDLGETMPAWQVQQSGYLTDQSVVPGVVAGPWAFTEGADTEYVASGVNSKGPRYPSLGRHGPFFQWGFSASPPQMTSEARRVFVNTICYIAKFDGQAPLTRKRTMHRGWALERAFGLRFLEERHASLVEHYEARKREYAAAAAVRDAGERALTAEEQYALKYPPRDAMSFDEYREMSLRGMPAELVERLGTTTESLEQYVSYYEQNLGYLRRADDGSGYVVDEDALALGIENRDPAILAHAVELLERGESDEQTRRAERLLRRYTDLELEDAASWRRWLDQVDGHLFFSDVAHMLSREGSHQGCPMGSFLFILTVAEAVEQIAVDYPSVTILGIADDYRFVGPTQDTLDAVAAYSAAVNRLGGVFQSEKSWLFSHSQATLNAAAQHEIATEMQGASPNEGVRILGAPYGGEGWCRNWLEEKNAEIKTHFDAIAELGRSSRKKGGSGAPVNAAPPTPL